MTYKPSPRPTFDGPAAIPLASTARHLWGDAEAGEVSDWIYVSSDKIHQLLFGLNPGEMFRHSPAHRTIFAADEIYYVVAGAMALANPATGEVQLVRAGEAAFFRRDTWHHALALGDEPLRVLEFFAPPPSQGTSGAYSRTRPYLSESRYVADQLLSRWPMERAAIEAGFSLRLVRDADLLWRIEGHEHRTLIGLLCATEHLTVGRADLHAAIDREGRRSDHRSDIASAFGDWESVRERVGELRTRAPQRIDGDVAAALRAAERDPAGCSDAQYLALATADGAALDAVAALADRLRQDAVGDDVTFVVNRNINFTNICYTGCRFCAFAQRKGDADAFALSTREVAERAWEAHEAGATEVCMQGGIDPDLPVTGYADMVRAVKARVPAMHVHAFSPMEIANGATRSGQSIREWLTGLREAGLDTIPGTAAEILDDEVRWVLTKGKLPTSMWVEIVTTAHEVGLRSSSTMMYGHVDSPAHWVAHINVLRAIQDRTGGFTEFVPLPFVHHSSPLYLAGAARPGPTHRDNRAVHALARIMLHGRIPHIQTSWVKLGARGSQVMLAGGADDLGGTLMEETISRMAGSRHGSARSVAELVAIAEGIGRPARQRTTTYASPVA